MTRIALACIAIFVLVGALFHLWKQEKRSETKKPIVPATSSTEIDPTVGRIVYTTRDIKKGEMFCEDSLELRAVSQNKIPQDAICAEEGFFERRARENIPKDHVMSKFDVNPDDLIKWTNFEEACDTEIDRELAHLSKDKYFKALYAISDIPARSRIGAFCVSVGEVRLSPKIPDDAAKSYKQIFGRVATDGFSQGEIIVESRLSQN